MRILRFYYKVALAGIAAGVWGASAQDVTTNHVAVQQTKTASAAMNEFGLKIVSNLSTRQPHKNVFVSPLSIFTALAMTEQGTTGATRDGIRQALAVRHDVTQDQLQGATSRVLKALEMDNSSDLFVANALWSGKHLAPGFTEQCRKIYRAEATTLDLSNPIAAANLINGWVKKATGARVQSIAAPEDLGGNSVVLTNAVYFHGAWSKPFPKRSTSEQKFHLADGGEKTVQMMYLRDVPGAYRKGDAFEAVALDYQSSHIRFYAILPRKGISPEEALAGISVQELEAAPGEPLDLALPRFTLDFSQALNDSLKSMGMTAAFAPSDDFRPMGAGKFSISTVLHRAVLEVDEEGTTASGASAVIMRGPPSDNSLHFDRPFAVLLCDTQTGAILFVGVVYEPRL